MTLRLAIENMDRLADGGPLRVEVRGRGLDIGRDAHLDWTLPDPSRYVSSKHCEIRFKDNEYWLFDVSTNGTFVNGAQFRIDAPYRLRDRDRLSIGPYVIAVSIEGAAGAQATPTRTGLGAAGPNGDVWGASGESAPPDDRAAYRVRKGPATAGDFLDFATDAGLSPLAPAASAWGDPAPPLPATDETWLTAPAPAPPPPPRRLGLDEFPTMERPHPTRPIEVPSEYSPAPAPPVAAPAPPPPPPIAAPAPPPDPPPPPPVFAPPPPPPPVFAPPPPAAAAPPTASDAALLERIAAAAGIPKAAIAGRDPRELADEIGAVLRLTAHNLVQMAASRRQTKSAIRSANHTMYKPTENNPIKFAADPEYALEIMFGAPSRMHLKASAAVSQVFEEAKAHSLLTFGAMQGAVDALFEDLSPDKIEASTGQDRGLGAMIASRKAKLWDVYAERWRALTKRADGRLNDAFTSLFAQAYDRLSDKNG